MDSIISYDYQGRARRLEIGSFLLITFIICAGLQCIEMLIQEYIYAYLDFFHFDFSSIQMENGYLVRHVIFSLHTLTIIYTIISLIPLFSVTARRLQDLNKSKYWIFYLLLPLFILLIVFFQLMIGLYFGMDLFAIESKYWCYIIAPLIIYWIYLILKILFQEGESEENRYGKSPK